MQISVAPGEYRWKEEIMFIHTTILKVSPENVHIAEEVLLGEKMTTLQNNLQGFQFGYLMESIEEPGKIVSLSFWDALADAQRTMSDPRYAELLGALRSILIAAPERHGYNQLKEVTAEQLHLD
jgi:hypothetical protein